MQIKNIFRRALFVALVASVPLMAQDHAVLLSGGVWTDLGTLPGQTFPYVAFSISDAGVSVGVVGNPDPVAFSYSGGVMSALPVPHSLPIGISPNGSYIVGWTSKGEGQPGSTAFLYDGSSIHNLSDGLHGCPAVAVNNTATVVGNCNLNGHAHAFIYSGSTMTDLTPDAIWSIANAVNSGDVAAGIFDQGVARLFTYSTGTLTNLGVPSQVVGYFVEPAGIDDSNVVTATLFVESDHGNVVNAFRSYYYDGTFHPIPYLSGDNNSHATAISNGVVVGYSWPSGHPFSFAISGAVLTDLGVAKTGGGNWSAVHPMGINASGQVVGYAMP